MRQLFHMALMRCQTRPRAAIIQSRDDTLMPALHIRVVTAIRRAAALIAAARRHDTRCWHGDKVAIRARRDILRFPPSVLPAVSPTSAAAAQVVA